MFANNNVELGNIDLTVGSIDIMAKENGSISIDYGKNGSFNLSGQYLDIFQQYISIAIELMNKVESDNLTIQYKRILGQLNLINKKLMIYFYSNGQGYENCIMTVVIAPNSVYLPIQELVFTGNEIKELISMIDKGNSEISRIRSEVAILNKIVEKTREIY